MNKMDHFNRVMSVIVAVLIALVVAFTIYHAVTPDPVQDDGLVEIDEYPVAIY